MDLMEEGVFGNLGKKTEPEKQTNPSSVRISTGGVHSFIGQNVLVSIVHIPSLAPMVAISHCIAELKVNGDIAHSSQHDVAYPSIR